MIPLPSPRERLADCAWLPRMIAKIRAIARGTLPTEYAARFCDRDSVDEHFLQFFGLEKDAILTAVKAADSNDTVAQWFCAQPQIDAGRIARWNELAENLGRSGFPMAGRFAAVLPTTYAHLDPAAVHSIFDLLEADERSARTPATGDAIRI